MGRGVGALGLRKGARGGGGPHETQEVRAMLGKAAKFWSAIGWEEAMVCGLREGARGGGKSDQQV